MVDVQDQEVVSPKVQDELNKLYPDARVAHVKLGGLFPFLADSETINMFIKVRAFGNLCEAFVLTFTVCSCT